ncbi:MAG: metallophosphoesterase, partial [Sphingobacteriales bacterium]
MKRKEFIRLSVPALVLLANGNLSRANSYYLSEDHKRKVKLRFAVASDGHYGQPNTEYAAFHEKLVNRVNEEHSRHAFAFCMINGDVVH